MSPPLEGNPPVSYWCATLLSAAGPAPAREHGVRLEVGPDGRISKVELDGGPAPGDIGLHTVLPGMANAHSHAFHRVLRGRTHTADDGDFWGWRQAMYRAAAVLDPERYYALARAVFAEMLVTGWTAVGEFHYLHHRADGTPYAPAHAMERAVVAAARDVGIRLVLLDTCYLQAGIGDRPLEPGQRAFGDGTAAAWLRRWTSLREELGADPDRRVSLGAAIHSVRAVPPEAIAEIVAGLPAGVPLHVHVSEQPQENADCLAAYGVTPTALLDRLGALDRPLAVVHATHLTDEDVARLGAAGVIVVMCPTTEADLGDGIGCARDLAGAGARIALGSDQNAVVDPFREMRDLEMGQRLASGRRARFDPAELLAAATTHGYEALGLGAARLRVGDLADLVELRSTSVTVGCAPEQLPLVATAGDVGRVVVHGQIVADGGRLASGEDPAALLRAALGDLPSSRHQRAR
ncbi:formimidoylglutamate deiminase [Pengzhenrongella phosphoraccumulans]|uniref:formimidoylglutamate deiminase n=1 Tax=Pengzhenrongella phosphoraccumulans TaxID=3114394 RepID=UPI00389079CA